jgi:hypothetical protein
MLNRDFERAAQGLKPLQKEFVACQTCGCTWFDKIEAIRVDLNQMVNLGSQVPVHGGPFHLLKCMRCNDIQEPSFHASGMSPLRTEYDDMLDQVVEGKGDLRDRAGTTGAEDSDPGPSGETSGSE